jgi:hypothetical protein
MSTDKVTKYIRLPEDYKSFPIKLLDAAFYNVLNDFNRNQLFCEMQQELKKKTLVRTRMALEKKNEIKLNTLKDLMQISIQDSMCLAIFSYKKMFPGKLDGYE